jgi:hypothetical protein
MWPMESIVKVDLIQFSNINRNIKYRDITKRTSVKICKGLFAKLTRYKDLMKMILSDLLKYYVAQ